MQFNYAALGCVLVLLTSQSARAQWTYDAVDALFAPGPTSTADESLSAAGFLESDDVNSLDSARTGLAVPETTPYSVPPHLTASDDEPNTELDVANSVMPGDARHKSKTSWPVDSVPEPSALAMGAVALMFFLFFVRRRRVG